MSDSPESPAGQTAANVTELETAKRAPEPPPPQSGGKGWMLVSLVLLVLLLVSGGINLWQREAQGTLAGEAAEAAELLAAETTRADAAEAEAGALRAAIGDVHANMTALQESLSEMIATTGGILEPSVAAADEASTLDAVVGAAGDALEAATDAASKGADAVVDAASSALRGAESKPRSESGSETEAGAGAAIDTGAATEREAALPDVAADPVGASAGEQGSSGVGAALTDAWTSTREGVEGLVDRAKAR